MEFKPGHTVGIDLGTTFSTLAHLDQEGNPVPIANDDDEVETPSLILLAESGHVVVGPSRMRAAMEDPDHVVERVKRYMGNVEYKRTFDGREITPEFLSALILKKLRQDAEKRIGKIGNAVITVPYYFNDARRKATEDAGRIAGLNVIDIINEPTAATLTYAWHKGELGAAGNKAQKPKLALVYDLGGGTFDVTVVRYTPSHFQVLATDGDVHLGGIDWNDRLVDYVAEEFKSKHGTDPRESPATLQMLRHDSDQAKMQLSTANEASITCRHEGKALNVPHFARQVRGNDRRLAAAHHRHRATGDGTGRRDARAARRHRAGGRLDPDAQGAAGLAGADRQRALSRACRRTPRWRRARPFTPPFSKPSSAANRASWPTASASCWATSNRKTSTPTAWASSRAIPRPARWSTT